MKHSLLAALLVTAGLLGSPSSAAADAYETTMAGALAKYERAAEVPDSSVRWIAKTYGLSPAQVREDLGELAARLPATPPPEANPEEDPPAPTNEAAPATPATTGSSPLKVSVSLDTDVLSQWAQGQGLDPRIFRLLRGLFGLFLLICAIPLWAAPRAMDNASAHVRSASVTSGILPRLLAIYLVGAGLWELAGAARPEQFALGRWVTIFKELGPPIQEAIQKLPIFAP